jgi:D-glycero-D-manno-heptose 1,7-bisphosphate phosphatase
VPGRRDRVLRWVLLDRDGTINVSPPTGDYVVAPDQLTLCDGAADAIRRLNEAGLWVGVVTNQRGIALGRMSAADVDAVHQRLRAMLGAAGARVDGVYVCPHEDASCDCRKPAPGLLRKAQHDAGRLPFDQCVVIGDSITDIQAGQAVGAGTVLLAAPAADRGGADHAAAKLADAVDWLLAGSWPQRDR